MASVPTGTTFYVASTIAAAKTTTVVTNASEAVVTSTAHGYSNGDFVIILSGWGRLNKRCFRVKSVTTDTFALEGADTTSTTLFPAGTGLGTVQKITAWTQVTLVTGISTSGGDPKTVSYKYIESDVEYSINDGFTAASAVLDIDSDAIGTAGYTALKALTDVQTDTVIRMVKRSGAISLRPCTVALNEDEQMTDGQITKVKASLNGNNRLTRYAS
jgi:hypothetical protein